MQQPIIFQLMITSNLANTHRVSPIGSQDTPSGNSSLPCVVSKYLKKLLIAYFNSQHRSNNLNVEFQHVLQSLGNDLVLFSANISEEVALPSLKQSKLVCTLRADTFL